MKSLQFAAQRPSEIRRPTIAQPSAPAIIFSGWGPRLAS
jgi:hypothetical protein